ncbi:MAG: MBL fold metallo-hydrolase [Chloroflexi bacterium]|nr:MBL fold metallo-hydrolase [Chloroflexota bacterium]
MAIAGENRLVLVDSVGNPLLRLNQAGLDVNQISDIIVTHFHPDHVSGLPLLLMDLWLIGRATPLNIHGLHYTIDRVESMMALYNWSDWPQFFPVTFARLPEAEMVQVLDSSEFRILASPVKHMIPNIGLRIEFKKNNMVMAYSCDTEPCAEVIRLANGADLLIHEASGESVGHSSAQQAGQVATRAEAGRLCLIHYPSGRYATGDPLVEARQSYQGDILLAKDFMIFDFNLNAAAADLGREFSGWISNNRPSGNLQEP